MDFTRIQDEPDALDAERHLSYLGIEITSKSSSWSWSCECFCGSPYATFNPDNRRFNCPKGSGCEIYWADLVRLTHYWVERGRPNPRSSSRGGRRAS